MPLVLGFGSERPFRAIGVPNRAYETYENYGCPCSDHRVPGFN